MHLDQFQSPLTPLVTNVGNFTFLAEEPEALCTHRQYDNVHARNSEIQEYMQTFANMQFILQEGGFSTQQILHINLKGA